MLLVSNSRSILLPSTSQDALSTVLACTSQALGERKRESVPSGGESVLPLFPCEPHSVLAFANSQAVQSVSECGYPEKSVSFYFGYPQYKEQQVLSSSVLEWTLCSRRLSESMWLVVAVAVGKLERALAWLAGPFRQLVYDSKGPVVGLLPLLH